MEQIVQLLPQEFGIPELSTNPETLIKQVFDWLDADSNGTIEERELTCGGDVTAQQSETLTTMLGSLPPYESSSVDLIGFGACARLRSL